ncbi:MAG: hypothetical protein RRB13_08790 [bacterium]|nr:hypothetical protein [bacterium]
MNDPANSPQMDSSNSLSDEINRLKRILQDLAGLGSAQIKQGIEKMIAVRKKLIASKRGTAAN